MSDHWAIVFQDAHTRDLNEGESLFRRGDPVEQLYLVRSGRIDLHRALQDGGNLTLHVAREGDVVAEASLFAERYHCDAIAQQTAMVAVLARRNVLSRLESSASDTRLALNALACAAREIQGLRTRIEIMRLKRVADRLDAYLELYGTPDKGGWVQVADWIGVTPPALYRELARRRTG